jgi:hypothetical protein
MTDTPRTPTTTAGRFLSDAIGDGYCEGWTVTQRDEFVFAIEAEARAPLEAEVERLREALSIIADPELIGLIGTMPGGFYCPWCGTNVNVHGTTCPVPIARAALSPLEPQP